MVRRRPSGRGGVGLRGRKGALGARGRVILKFYPWKKHSKIQMSRKLDMIMKG